ncbi:MAG: hypothetical protein M1365_11635, partial [Actinobacteria bacterium]|nr:hypothetical protein [Actinomycetota bacterium]
MSFLEGLKQQRAKHEARAREDYERRLPEITAALRRQKEQEKEKQLKITAFKDSLVLRMARELAELLPHGEYYYTDKNFIREEDIGHARCRWLIESSYYGGVNGYFDIFGKEDGRVTVGETSLTTEEAGDTASVDRALEFNYRNPKREKTA